MCLKTSEFLNAVCEALELDTGSLTVQDTPETVPAWDSIGHLQIIGVIDAELNVQTDEDEELQRFASMGELVERLEARGALESDT
jgi:acyl carrier protein